MNGDGREWYTECTPLLVEMASNKGPTENRLRAYKTKGLDATEVRRRREEEGVQLRRSRRDEQVRTAFTETLFHYAPFLHCFLHVCVCINVSAPSIPREGT